MVQKRVAEECFSSKPESRNKIGMAKIEMSGRSHE
jgi:hypothetical protein